MKKLLAGLCILLFSLRVSAQVSLRDSSASFVMIGATFAYQWPGGDLADRFGSNFNVGGVFQWKLKNNFIFGFDGNFLFKDKIKETGILDSLKGSEGYFIDGEGHYSTINLVERGFKFELKAGKIVPWIGPNKNSGILFTLGGGILQHKIRIESPGNVVPFAEGDYLKGYDRLTNGFSLTEFMGYVNFANKRLVNFYGGLEFTQAFTQNRRSYNFDQQKRDDKHRMDLLFGIRLAWIIPIYKRAPRQFYYD